MQAFTILADQYKHWLEILALEVTEPMKKDFLANVFCHKVLEAFECRCVCCSECIQSFGMSACEYRRQMQLRLDRRTKCTRCAPTTPTLP